MLVDANSESISKNPIYGEIAGEVGTLICYAPIEKEWQRQAYIALNRSLSRYGWYKMRGLKDLPYAYLILAELHDYFNPFKPIITSELQELQRKDSRIGISPLFCKNCLQEIRNDLMQRGLLPDAGIQPDEINPPAKDESSKEHANQIEVPWSDDARDYMHSSEAIVKFTNNKMSVSKLSKLLTPEGTMRYMRKKGRGCKVHIVDFIEYAKKKYPPDDMAADITGEYLADIEARKRQERQKNINK